MNNILDEYYRKYVITKERVLEEVDEWCLYYHYLGIENLQLRQAYNSPIRLHGDFDFKPSFSIFENTRGLKNNTEFLWKDGAKNLWGDVFDLIGRIYNISEEEVLQLINNDFAILDDSIEVTANRIIQRPSPKPETRIRIKSKPFTKEAIEFWKSHYISADNLQRNKVQLVDFVWFNDEQIDPYKVKELMFAYCEWNTETNKYHYQLYAPFSKEFKFRNNLFENQVFSYHQLEYKSKILVITKSKKDIICLNQFGVEAIAARSETTRIKQKTIELLQSKYEEVILLFDNDLAGIQAVLQYNLKSVIIPIESGCKDFSDYLKLNGLDKSKELLIKLGILN